jgi:three-Cys-motif partner protein
VVGYIINLDDQTCEEIKWHSRQKHAFLEAYLNIWSEQVGKTGQTIPTLAIFDLFASFGLCHCSEKDETWDGSALLAAKCLKKYQGGQKLFLNTYSPIEEERLLQKDVLDKNISNLDLPRRINTIIKTLPIEKAVESAISFANPRYPNLWILDPYQPEHLPWAVVEKICKLEGIYRKRGKEVSRRPELFICLMTGRLQRLSGMESLENDIVGKALGMEEMEWKSKLNKYLENGYNTRESLIFLYAEKIGQYYKKPPIILEVPSNIGNIVYTVYTVFLCTDHVAGHYVMKIHKLPEYQKWQQIEWKGEAKIISKKKKVITDAEKSGQEQTFLEVYFD